MRPRFTLTAAALLAGAVLAAPGLAPVFGQEERDLLDYALVQRTLPRLREIGDASGKRMLELHDLMETLDKGGLTTPEQTALREKIRDTLQDYSEGKEDMKDVLRELVRIEPSGLTDQEVVDRINSRELVDIHWRDATFRKCMRDLSDALGVRVRMAYAVVQMNTVTLDFPRASGSAALGSLCNFFDLRYVVQDGEVVIFKKITPNEERFLEYAKNHPGVKLKYWERETATGEYKKEEKK